MARLKGRLEKFILGENGRVSRAAVRILGLDLRERQLSSMNRPVLEGSGATIQIVNFADCSETRDTDDKPKAA